MFRKLDTGSDACYSLDMDIENTPKNTQVLGLAVGPGYMNQPHDLIGEVAQSATGNTVLRIGREITSGEPGWTRVAHVVLTPEERDDLIAQLVAQGGNLRIFSPEIEQAFPGDLVAGLVADTLVGRGMGVSDACTLAAEVFDYDMFGRLIDQVENTLEPSE